MSGGSFDYLCWADVGELHSDGRQQDLERMRDALLELNLLDAAAQTDAVLETMRLAEKLVEMRRRGGLSDIWHAVEWWKSGDSGPDAVREAVEKWRKGVSG